MNWQQVAVILGSVALVSLGTGWYWGHRSSELLAQQFVCQRHCMHDFRVSDGKCFCDSFISLEVK